MTLLGAFEKKWPGRQENAVFVTRTLSKSRNGESREQTFSKQTLKTEMLKR